MHSLRAQTRPLERQCEMPLIFPSPLSVKLKTVCFFALGITGKIDPSAGFEYK